MSSTESSPTSSSGTLEGLRLALEGDDRTSRGLVEECLARIDETDGEGKRVFTHVARNMARIQADQSDARRADGTELSPFDGIPLSIKDLFDIEGEVTTAGSVVLKSEPPARADSVAVARLRAAGFVFMGRTNMTEFAFSGLGINPRYGTPLNPWDRAHQRIPGGSSSGAAVSITDGMAFGALGTDTGGSCRIPAALCGIVGFKPTARRVPLTGAYPLAPSLDSIGPLAHSVTSCAILDSVLTDEPYTLPAVRMAGFKLGIPRSWVFEGVSTEVLTAFDRAVRWLTEAGARIEEIAFEALNELSGFYDLGGLPAAEAYAWHRARIESDGSLYDPRVRTRIERAREQKPGYADGLRSRRKEFIKRVNPVMARFDALLMPTVPIVAPRRVELVTDEAYVRLNALVLRNSSAVNFMDGCAVSIPCHEPGKAPVGLTLFAPGGRDQHVLAVAMAAETVLREAGIGLKHPPGD